MEADPQLKWWACCQICGETVPRSKAGGWLISPYRKKPHLDIVRCPRHISEWALRQSSEGRTKEWRARMAEGRKLPPQVFDPMLAPMPMEDIDPATNASKHTDFR